MARDQRLLPRRKFRVDILQHLLRTLLKLRDFGVHIDLAGLRGVAKFGDSGFQRGDGLLEIKKCDHDAGVRAARAGGQRADGDG